MNDNILLAKKMLAMHAKHQDGWVEACYHTDCDWVELPIPGQSKGRSGNAAAMKKQYLPQLTDLITKQYDEAFANSSISPPPVPDEKFKYINLKIINLFADHHFYIFLQ